ncbi:serine proteinase stubble-like isoform X2 [Sipha flava]|uniref:Serine proteinase stubble-like isoform X2 n=1 Tax=Sipha flava TaxID=143950 RepID=A0A8B8FBF3_9HEMI|nr:serine proteinase stubble-like isoform X2 [Sipha flava]
MKIISGLLFLWLSEHTSWAAHPPSPCPDVFSYEGSEPEINKWYGEISLRTDESLAGVRLNIELDRPSDLMSWMGDTTTNDNVKFTILNLEQRLRPGPPVLTRIMVKFNRTTGSPRVRFIRLNGRKICPEDSISAHSEVPGPNKRQTTKRPDPDFEVNNFGENVNEYTNSNSNSNNRPSTQTNNNIDYNNLNNNYNNNNNPSDTDYLSSSSNNNRPASAGYRPVVTNTDEPSTTRRSTKATTRNPYEGTGNRPNNNPNTVSLQASTDSNSEITGVINGLLQDQKKNKTVIITVIDNSQQQGSQEQQNHPNTGNGARPVAVDNNNNNNYNSNPGNSRPSSNTNSGSSRPNTNNKPTEQLSTNQKPNNNNYNQGDSYSSNVNSQQLSAGSCGEVKLAVPLVTAGQSTHRGQWPWHVALYLIEGINLSYHCGGSLVSKNKVITAAHCVTNRVNDFVLNSSKIVVYLGKYHQLQYSDELGVQTKQVVRINVFPSYNSSNYLGDIAVLTLSSDAEFTNYVTPVCLWDNNFTDLSEIEGKDGTVVGWGFDENDTPTEELKMARMPVVSHETCLWSYPKFYSEFTSDNTFCAGFRNGTSVCNGDSGGGMVFKKNSRWYLRGIVSITVAKEGQRVCDTKHYVVFTDVAKYHDFISKNMR